jgi:hypothetical protein
VLKKRKRDEDWATKKAAAATEAKHKAVANRKEYFKRAESYVKEYRTQVGDGAPACRAGDSGRASCLPECCGRSPERTVQQRGTKGRSAARRSGGAWRQLNVTCGGAGSLAAQR